MRSAKRAQPSPVMVTVLGFAAWALALLEVWRWQGGVVRLPLPIGRAVGGLPLPLATWLAVAGYVVGYHAVFPAPAAQRWARAIRLGFTLHVFMLLSHTVWLLARGSHPPVSVWYLRYADALIGAVLAAGLVVASQTLPRCAGGHRQPLGVYAPLSFGYATLWAVTAASAPRLAIAAAVAGVGAAAAARRRHWREAAVRVGRWLWRERIFLSVVWLAALALRLLYLSRVLSDPNYLETGSDGRAYDALAWALVRGVEEPTWGGLPLFAPGYVRFVALLYWLGGRSYALVGIVQSVIGAAACLLLYDVAKRLFGEAVARAAALFGAVNFLMVFAASAIGHQALDLFWTLLVVWCLVRYVERPERWGRWMIVIGALLGWAGVTREGNIALWLALIPWCVLAMGRRLGWGRATAHAAMLSLGTVAVLWPFVHGHGGGVLGRIGKQWFYCNNGGINIHDWFNPWIDPAGAWALLRVQPLAVLLRLTAAIGANLVTIFFHQDFGSFDLVFLLRPSLYYYGLWLYAYVCTLAGLWFVARSALREPARRAGWWLILTLLASRSLVHLLLEASYRHRTPLEPYLIMLASYGLMRIVSIGRSTPGARA